MKRIEQKMCTLTKDDLLLSLYRAEAFMRDHLKILNESGEYEYIRERIEKRFQEVLTLNDTPTSKNVQLKRLDDSTKQLLLLQIDSVIREFVNWRPKD